MRAYRKDEVDIVFSGWKRDLEQLDELEVYTKDEVTTMLTDLKSEIEEMDSREHECDFATPWCIDKGVVVEIIQEKINSLKEAVT